MEVSRPADTPALDALTEAVEAIEQIRVEACIACCDAFEHRVAVQPKGCSKTRGQAGQRQFDVDPFAPEGRDHLAEGIEPVLEVVLACLARPQRQRSGRDAHSAEGCGQLVEHRHRRGIKVGNEPAAVRHGR